ncbi:MAG TPA: hypothetical protein VMF67_07715, partial [Rhizomicrobium sp.]|nr:hypothetical protein [Rhizomicrobium sp.]
RPRIAYLAEIALEFAHLAPLSNREPSSESCSRASATGLQKPKAIPLPYPGGKFGTKKSRPGLDTQVIFTMYLGGQDRGLLLITM